MLLAEITADEPNLLAQPLLNTFGGSENIQGCYSTYPMMFNCPVLQFPIS